MAGYTHEAVSTAFWGFEVPQSAGWNLDHQLVIYLSYVVCVASVASGWWFQTFFLK